VPFAREHEEEEDAHANGPNELEDPADVIPRTTRWIIQDEKHPNEEHGRAGQP